MKTNLLAVPIKKSDDVNWLPPLKHYINSVYGKDNEFQQDLAGFNKLRQDLRGVNADNTGISLYYKYYSQLELLDLRIPINSVLGKKVSFVWYEAFTSSVSHKQHSLPFEKANVLFNIAAILNKVAIINYNEGDNGFKDALEKLQQVSGIFKFISENFLHAPSDDLSQTSLKFLTTLMLAQSQEIFVLKVITGDMDQSKNSLIAKLCASASNYYRDCNDLIDYSDESRESISTADFDIIDTNEEIDDLQPIGAVPGADTGKILIKLDLLWTSLIELKQTYYKSLTYYFQGLHLEKANKFGDAIAYFQKSSDTLNQIDSITLKQVSRSNHAFETLDNYKYHKDALNIKLAEINKDNDLIYHEIIPSLVTLPEIKPLDSVKIIPMKDIKVFNDINDHNYETFLKNVVPIDIHELLSYYSEEKSQFLRNELDMVDVSNEELASILEYLKMPKAIVNLKEILSDNTGSPQAEISGGTLAKVNEIAGEYKNDTTNKEFIVQKRKDIYRLFNEIERQTNYSSKEDIIKLKKSLYDATTSDDKLFGLISNDTKLYEILGNGTRSPQFHQLFDVPQPVSASTEISLLDIMDTTLDPLDSQIKSIEEILYDLNMIKINKQKLVENLKTEIHNDDISDILVLNSKVKTNSEIKNVIFPQELKKFEPYATELDNLNEKQKEFINNLKDQWNKLSSNPKVKEIQSSKVFKDTIVIDQVTRIEEFYKQWKRYNQGLKQGTKFYKDLEAYATSLRDQINEGDLSNRFADLRPSVDESYQQTPPQGYSTARGPSLPPKPSKVETTTPNPNPNPNSNLIYDQPSTYNPNMYNFFSKQ